MDHSAFANRILRAIEIQPAEVPAAVLEETRRNNAARCMAQLICNRLSSNGHAPERIKHTTYRWMDGVFALRNARITDHHWSTLQLNVAEQLHQDAQRLPLVYVLTYWAITDGKLHVWVIPENVAYRAFAELPIGKRETHKTVELFPETHILKNAPNAPDLSPYYLQSPLLDLERARIIEAIKIDQVAKHAAQSDADIDETDDIGGGNEQPFFTTAAVDFMKELPDHVEDADWHEKNKSRYEQVLRDPARAVVVALRNGYIERLSPEVAGGKRHLSILKKNDYGKGGYHDHYWFAFYDPVAGSKTKSVQLFFRMLGSEQVWRYGFGMGNYCDHYIDQLKTAIRNSRDGLASYIRQAPPDTSIRLFAGDEQTRKSPDDFANALKSGSGSLDPSDGLTNISIVREYPLDSLPDRHETLIDEIGQYFTWAWPFFEASMTGKWPESSRPRQQTDDALSDEDVDEEAPKSLLELHQLTALPQPFLDELEQSLLAKQQTVLVGPPGTSKTYISRHFARYFVRQRPGRPQGSHHVLYMHTNWTYEDFFEGIKPATTKDGQLVFETKRGFFLEWVEQLKGFDPAARHVLVLDEINRCETAAVLGELLQLLEYRGTTVRLLSGRRFVFPRNLFVIGTMNSADRSIGRMDLALRRRFLWLNLYPQSDALQSWLDRTGNNPVGFKASSLSACNELLAKKEIPPEQHIGHALFMVQESDADDEMAIPQDIPLTENHLRRIVQFSVLPYVRELFTTQFGQADEDVIRQMRSNLLDCVGGASQPQQENSEHDARS